MIIVYILLFALMFLKIRTSGKGFYKEDVLEKGVTDSIKGVCIWLVFLTHFASYVSYESTIDILGGKISNVFGQLIVAPFLFFSGYGVCESIRKKGDAYLRQFPKNRILKTTIHFFFAVLLFLILALIRRQELTFTKVLLSFVGWDSLGNSNWYIFVVLGLYIITWLSFVLIKKEKVALLLVTFLSIAFMVLLYFTKETWWYDTLICYVLGMWFSVYKTKVVDFFTKNNVVWCLFTILVIALLSLTWFVPSIKYLSMVVLLIKAPLLCLLILLILLKFKISNGILRFCGIYLFEIYILQRLPMIIFKDLGILDVSIYLYFAICLIMTIGLAIGFKFVIKKLDCVIFKAKKQEKQL